MEQLVMNWRNDGTQCTAPVFPEGVALVTFPELPNGREVWLDIVRFLDPDGTPIAEDDYYDKAMLSYTHYREDQCYFLTVEGVPAATITVICDEAQKKGYIHMVASKPEYRGRGLGHLLNDVAVQVLKDTGMQTAYLTTDDWRIPAIKTYLKAGFVPDLDSEPDYKERWQKIYETLNP